MKVKILTAEEFNTKYKDYLEEGYYGLALRNSAVVDYLDEQFQELIKIPGFKYTQIKVKFDNVRFYCIGVESEKITEIENKIKELL